MTQLSPTPLTDALEERLVMSQLSYANRAGDAVAFARSLERSLAERTDYALAADLKIAALKARIAELRENGDRLVTAADGWKADAIEWQEKYATLEARNAELVLQMRGCLDDYLWLRDNGGQMNANCCNERIELIHAALTEQQ